MLRDFIKRHRIATVLIILFVLGFIGFSIYTVVSRLGKEPVDILLLPSDTKLTVNGEQRTPGTAYLVPGEYTVEATRGGFKTEKTTVTIVSPNTLTIDIALEPVSESAVKWAKDNEQLYLDYEGREGLRTNQEGETFSALNPITSVLPHEDMLYTIGYRADTADPSGNSIIIEIDAIGGYRNAAIDELRSLGYDPTNLKIQFRDYESPFSHE
jgi:hypothetical protein